MNYKDVLINLREGKTIKDRDIKQKEIAKKLGISNQLYNIYENQTKIIPVKYLDLLCEIFDISIDFLFSLTKQKKYNNTKNINISLSAKRIKNLRIELNLKQHEFAKNLNISQSVISDYENQKRIMATPFLYDICKKYNISADYLLGKIDSPKNI